MIKILQEKKIYPGTAFRVRQVKQKIELQSNNQRKKSG
jgi:hypothetical protein